ncbi:hypothetical protein HKX48_001216 [Thoreauomyces humboldtii]|nr:hypothetical protein HKX48_001216 [Thoreauomyces humboldtii]
MPGCSSKHAFQMVYFANVTMNAPSTGKRLKSSSKLAHSWVQRTYSKSGGVAAPALTVVPVASQQVRKAAPPSRPAPTAPLDFLEYRIVNVPLSLFGYSMKDSPREKFNVAIGHVIHMTSLLSEYLHIDLPFVTVYKGAQSYAHAYQGDVSKDSYVPLQLTDTNSEEFIEGLSMLNYNVAFLCYSQGIEISLYEIPNTLENLARCCQASSLGREWPPRSSLMDPSTTGGTELQLPMQFSKVLQLHAALHKRRWAAAALTRLREGTAGDEARGACVAAVDIGGRNAKLLQQILSEDSEDEEESSTWHLVDEM